MDRNIRRELHLTKDEVADAIVHWLVYKHDIQLGEGTPTFEFDVKTPAPFCKIITESDDERDLLRDPSYSPVMEAASSDLAILKAR